VRPARYRAMQPGRPGNAGFAVTYRHNDIETAGLVRGDIPAIAAANDDTVLFQTHDVRTRPFVKASLFINGIG
jgi:hypothetical protein